MKQLSLEQKAKRYDEAIKIAKEINNEQRAQPFNVMTRVFPELKEKESDDDERIRKDIISHFTKRIEGSSFDEVREKYKIWIAWLEKQVPTCLSHDDEIMIRQLTEYFTTGKGLQNTNDTVVEWLEDVKRKFEKQSEQKTPIIDFKAKNWYTNKVDGKIHDMTYNIADKVEPKFKVGDWITNGDKVTQIVAVGAGLYIINRNDMSEVSLSTEYIEKWYHLWSIQDAKDGDVLIDKSGSRECPFIFKETKPSDIKTDMLNPLTILGYCGIGGAGFTKGSGWGDTANCIYYPATKEQCDTLLKAMADGGYIFDFEKKELKKINSDLTEFENALADICRGWIGEELGWKDYIIKNSFPLLELAKKQFDKYEQNHAWSEEDEKNINFLCELLTDLQVKSTENEIKHGTNSHSEYYYNIKKWLKSLKDSHAWKPSDEHYELEEFAKIVRGNLTGISKAVQALFENKYLKLTGREMYGGFKD